MMPRSLSATAIQTAMSCMSRFEAEHMTHGRGQGNMAATVGTTVHYALEMYVKAVYLEKVQEKSLMILLMFFDLGYQENIGEINKKDPNYKDGVDMLTRWFERDDLGQPGRTVVSCEQKVNFPLWLPGNKSISVPFNYIWDRFDQIGDTVYRVVDYKTNRYAPTAEELREKPQARAYGLAAQIQYPHATRIWVEFDMLRHSGPVGVVFTKEENLATFREFQRIFQEIVNTAQGDATETLNDQCLFCVKKTTCSAVIKNAKAGGVHSLATLDQRIDRRAQLEFALKAAKSALSELDKTILAEARELDIPGHESESTKMTVYVGGVRQIDPERAEKVLGDQLWRKYGSRGLAIGVVDDLLKGSELTEDQKRDLRSLIYKKDYDPSVRTKVKTAFTK